MGPELPQVKIHIQAPSKTDILMGRENMNGKMAIGITVNGKKGKREGKGTMFYKEKDSKDSLLTGYWKNDKYIGKYEKPYIVHSKTPDISFLDVTRENSLNKEISFEICCLEVLL